MVYPIYPAVPCTQVPWPHSECHVGWGDLHGLESMMSAQIHSSHPMPRKGPIQGSKIGGPGPWQRYSLPCSIAIEPYCCMHPHSRTVPEIWVLSLEVNRTGQFLASRLLQGVLLGGNYLDDTSKTHLTPVLLSPLILWTCLWFSAVFPSRISLTLGDDPNDPRHLSFSTAMWLCSEAYARLCRLQLRSIAQRSAPRKPRPRIARTRQMPSNFQAGRPTDFQICWSDWWTLSMLIC